MTFVEFLTVLLATNIVYVAGDQLYALGVRTGKTALLRAGCLMVAAAFGTLIYLGVTLAGLYCGVSHRTFLKWAHDTKPEEG